MVDAILDIAKAAKVHSICFVTQKYVSEFLCGGDCTATGFHPTCQGKDALCGRSPTNLGVDGQISNAICFCLFLFDIKTYYISCTVFNLQITICFFLYCSVR